MKGVDEILNSKEAKKFVKNLEPTFLDKAPDGGYICPRCGNGSGANGTGLALDPHDKSQGNHYKCFACGGYMDVIDLWKAHNQISDDREAFNSIYRYYGVEVEYSSNEPHSLNKPVNPAQQSNFSQDKQKTILEYELANRKAYLEDVALHGTETDYWSSRGISNATVEELHLGYDAQCTEKGINGVWKAAIIPTSEYTAAIRNTDNAADKNNRYRKIGNTHLYKLMPKGAEKKPIWIVEGEIDAITLYEVNSNAYALGSAANYRLLLDDVNTNKPNQPLILALDQDEPGKKTTENLLKELQSQKIETYVCDPYDGHKDANEALLADRYKFKETVAAIEAAPDQYDVLKEKRHNEYIQAHSVHGKMNNFLNGISASAATEGIPTGFPILDQYLEGGLYEGLYVIGAMSSLGKTTFALQIVDQIAENQQKDVLIFSLEMALTELMSKSISRFTCIDMKQDLNGDMRNAKTARGITTGSRHKNYSKEELNVIDRAYARYDSFANHIFIYEGIGNIGIDQIVDKVQEHIAETGQKPVVMIDYLQILAPYDMRATDKQNIDKTVIELKRLSRDYKIPVIAISSVNRMSYKDPMNESSFKESGAIEYSSDVLIGLQFEGCEEKKFKPEKAKAMNPRKIELKILKNRNGAIPGSPINYNFYSMFNYFNEQIG